ncbi:hypothetical protein M885DRAFT_558227 [Pelagophyceae sp. CCMP2097]|nr:hypothetical protein M885DRAFT_558227 [Pelagophyceae sp. CCMP2097]
MRAFAVLFMLSLASAFGATDLPRLWADFHYSDTIRIIPAVRDPEADCVDERGCAAEKVFACAIEACGASLQAANACAVEFMRCADTHAFTNADALAEKCAASSPDAVEQCANGRRGAQLLSAASQLFNEQYPKTATIPALAVDGVPLAGRTADAVTAAACAAGSKANVCGSSRVVPRVI